MPKRCPDQATVTIRRAIHLPIWWWATVILACVLFGRIGTSSHAEDQPVGIAHSTDMIGKLVKNLDGKNVGTIKDLVINWRSGGYIEYAVLSFGGFLGLGDEYVAVPWKSLTLSDNKEHFVLSRKEEYLKDIPGFVAHRFYDRSSVVAQRGGRSIVLPSARTMKGGIGSDVNVSVARSFDMQYAMERSSTDDRARIACSKELLLSRAKQGCCESCRKQKVDIGTYVKEALTCGGYELWRSRLAL